MKIAKSKHVNQVLTLERYLDNHDDVLKSAREKYKRYKSSVELLDFQTALVNAALKSDGWWTAELATGIGKSIIAARIAAGRLRKGPAIFICPSSAALGDSSDGIINKFVRTFETLNKKCTLGELNDLSAAYDVSFVTPHRFVQLLEHEPRRTLKALRTASTLIIDEAHHFPEDENEKLVVYGKIYRAAREYMRHGLVAAMTGTWCRLDRKTVMGTEKPETVLTVQQAIDLGRAPNIYGIQVITDVRASGASSRGDLYDLHLSDAERAKYLRGIADCISTTYRRYPVPFAAFARTRADAATIAEHFNRTAGRPKMIVLDTKTSLSERKQAVVRLKSGELAGYITCAVGEEALDVPPLEIVHLIRRTRSLARNVQAVGRALRVCEGKRRALIIDYHTMIEGIYNKFVGLSLDDLARHCGSRVKKWVSGGPLVAQRGCETCAVLRGISMGEERTLLCKRDDVVDAELIMRVALEMARRGMPKPGRTGVIDTDVLFAAAG